MIPHLCEILAGDCHVSWSDMRVVRYVYSRMDRRARKNRDKTMRKVRHGVYRAVLRAHHRNQKLFREMGF